ncbi:MAG: AMP phosphorylase [Halobacteriales archaeon]|nr:AMP phosphorylase [Halobacteriales archaeon]
MEFVAEEIDIGTRTPTVLVHSADVEELGAHPLDRVLIRHGDRVAVGIVEVTDELVDRGTLAVTRPLGHIEGQVDVTLAPRPDSAEYIRKKLDRIELEAGEIGAIVADINRDRLSDVELSSFVTSLYTNGLSRAEIGSLTQAMVDAGETLSWDREVVADKHSIGGVAGNRVTPVVVSIVAAAGLTIPKTSSRAVTSAAGTADTMEVFCDVAFDTAELQAIVEATGGCLAWGGAVNLSPVDDKIIRVETPLSLDPPGQLIASVLSKKRSAGSTHIVIDIPYGEGAKVANLGAARELAEDFGHVGEQLGLRVECALTRGHQPIGRGIGPVLEARDVLAVLEGEGPAALRSKSLRLAEMLLAACEAEASAEAVLDDGRALAKFREIIAAQGGDPDVARADLEPGEETAAVRAEADGVVRHVDNRLVNGTARRAGSPKDRRAGLELHLGVGDEVAAGDPLFTVHAETRSKLEEAREFAADRPPVRVNSADETVVERF